MSNLTLYHTLLGGLSHALVPALMVLFIKGKIRSEAENPINRFLTRIYRPALDWVLARPQPGSAAEIENDAAGRLARLRQSGWEIRYPRYADETPGSLPTRLELQRADLQVQLLIDEWKFIAP